MAALLFFAPDDDATFAFDTLGFTVAVAGAALASLAAVRAELRELRVDVLTSATWALSSSARFRFKIRSESIQRFVKD